MGNKQILLPAVLCLGLSVVATQAADTQIQASDSGTVTVQGDVVNTDGDFTVTKNYGLNEEKLKAMLEQREDRLIKKLLAASGDEKKRRVLEEQLRTVQAQKADLKKALKKEIQLRKNTEKTLEKLQGQLPPARLAEAGRLLQKGDTTAAEQLFEEVVRKEGKAVALAAYQNGQLAEGRLDYVKAMRQYRKAVALEENNLDYLLAGAKMSRTMANYNQAQEWLEQLLSIKQQEGVVDLILSNILKELASLYHFRGFYKKAEKLYNRSLVIIEKILGKEHSEVAIILKDMAALYETQARYEDAESLYKRVQKIVGKPSKRIIPTRPIPPSLKKTNIESILVATHNTINYVDKVIGDKIIYSPSSFREVIVAYNKEGNSIGIADNPSPIQNAIMLLKKLMRGEEVKLEQASLSKFLISSGTEISILESDDSSEQPPTGFIEPIGFTRFIKIKIIEGPHKGKTGWIHASMIMHEQRRK